MSDDKEPTQEQIKEFWEWVGLKLKDMHYKHTTGFNYHGKVYESEPKEVYHWILDKGVILTEPEGVDFGLNLPPIDMNHIFSYALSSVNFASIADVDQEGKRFFSAEVLLDGTNNIVIHEDPALALFWAIWEVIKSG